MQNEYTNDYEQKLKIIEVLYLCKELLEKHKLGDVEIVLRNHFNALGKCYSDYKISLQVEHVLHSDIDEIHDTILHEIAHALVGCENGHNEVWQNKAKELGVKFNINYRK